MTKNTVIKRASSSYRFGSFDEYFCVPHLEFVWSHLRQTQDVFGCRPIPLAPFSQWPCLVGEYGVTPNKLVELSTVGKPSHADTNVFHQAQVFHLMFHLTNRFRKEQHQTRPRSGLKTFKTTGKEIKRPPYRRKRYTPDFCLPPEGQEVVNLGVVVIGIISFFFH